MDLATASLTASAGVGGVLLGTFLRPVVGEWFALRRKTLHVIVQEPSEFRAPHQSVQLSWHGEDVRRLIQTGFLLENRTGRTLRNFRIEIAGPARLNNDQLHAVYLEDDARARYTVGDEGASQVFSFELIEPNTSISGSMLSNYTHQIKITSLDDVELRERKPGNGGGWARFVSGVATALAAVSVTATAAAFIGS